MKKASIIAVAIANTFISGCASQPQPFSSFEAFHPQDLNGPLSSGQYVQKIDNFFVINDSSSSMADNYQGAGYPAQPSPTKLSVEKEILNRINQTIPDLKLTSSIRSFGFGHCLSWSFTQLNQPPTDYSKMSFANGISSLTCGSGGSPLDSALEETNKDLSSTTGNTAVLILSDGQVDTDPVPAVKALRQRYGNNLCVYNVWVGNNQDEYGRAVLNQLSDIGGCGFGTTAERISSPEDMTRFVRTVFLKAGTPVADCSTQDDDGDGVNNCTDKCPDTLKGAPVNPLGCWVVDVKFDNDKSNIKPEYYPELDKAVAVIQQNPGVNIEVQGHTSSTGTIIYNQRLSERRAQAVKNYLSGHRQTGGALTARGYGLTRPIDTNETEAGRANNRRVQLEVLK